MTDQFQALRDALEAVSDAQNTMERVDADRAFRIACDHSTIRALLDRVDAQRWIPVSEQLPERVPNSGISAAVLCCLPSGAMLIDCCHYEYQHKDYDYGGPKVPAFASPYTHWRKLPPLPSAPTEEKQ